MLQGVNFQSDAQGVMHTNPIIFNRISVWNSSYSAREKKKITPKCPNVNIYQNRHLISRCILMSTTVL